MVLWAGPKMGRQFFSRIARHAVARSSGIGQPAESRHDAGERDPLVPFVKRRLGQQRIEPEHHRGREPLQPRALLHVSGDAFLLVGSRGALEPVGGPLHLLRNVGRRLVDGFSGQRRERQHRRKIKDRAHDESPLGPTSRRAFARALVERVSQLGAGQKFLLDLLPRMLSVVRRHVDRNGTFDGQSPLSLSRVPDDPTASRSASLASKDASIATGQASPSATRMSGCLPGASAMVRVRSTCTASGDCRHLATACRNAAPSASLKDGSVVDPRRDTICSLPFSRSAVRSGDMVRRRRAAQNSRLRRISST